VKILLLVVVTVCTLSYEIHIPQLLHAYSTRRQQTTVIDVEESKQRIRAEDARKLKKKAEEAKKMTVDDLTKGIVNYNHLGLDFETTSGENELRYVCVCVLNMEIM
jgi:hypothetical protein